MFARRAAVIPASGPSLRRPSRAAAPAAASAVAAAAATAT